jgi:hypothetical protein
MVGGEDENIFVARYNGITAPAMSSSLFINQMMSVVVVIIMASKFSQGIQMKMIEVRLNEKKNVRKVPKNIDNDDDDECCKLF